MKIKTPLLFLVILFTSFITDFRSEQKAFPRVREAYQVKESVVKKKFTELGLTYTTCAVFLRVFKKEEEMELWVKKTDGTYVLYKTFSICSMSGDLGPKRKQGDHQVPEGFYYIDRFNPSSSFHLSLGINYPNASDRILSNKAAPGGDIFIHGSCVSIGCMAMTDEVIKEIYVMAVEAKSNGQSKIPVHIFPFKMNAENTAKYFAQQPELKNFWMNIGKGYDSFEKNKRLSAFTVNEKGEYVW